MGLALAPKQRAYVATAEGIAVMDIQRHSLAALIAYQSEIG
jgi:hypothetical protein